MSSTADSCYKTASRLQRKGGCNHAISGELIVGVIRVKPAYSRLHIDLL